MTIFLLLLFDWVHALLGGQRLLWPPQVFYPMLALGFLEFHIKGWLQYCAIMRLAMVRDQGKLSWMQTFLGTGCFYLALAWDVLMNVFATLWLLQLPFQRTARDVQTDNRLLAFLFHRQWLLSQRLEFNVYHGPEGWRKQWSERFRSRLLDNIDPRGIHRS